MIRCFTLYFATIFEFFAWISTTHSIIFVLTSGCFSVSAGFANSRPQTSTNNREHPKKVKRWTSFHSKNKNKGPRGETRSMNNGSSLRKSISLNKKIIEIGKTRVWNDLLDLYANEKAAFNEVNYATILSQLSRIRRGGPRREPAVLGLIVQDVCQLEMEGFAVRDMVNIAHSQAKLRMHNNPYTKEYFARMDRCSTKILDEGNLQDISNSVWACATLGLQCSNLFAGLDGCTEKILEEGDPQHISNTVWACATLGVQSPKLFAELDQYSKKILDGGTSQAISNTVWACATLGVQCPKLFERLDRCSERILDGGTYQAIANIVWSCATLGVPSPKLFEGLDRYSERILQSPQSTSNTVWACATLGIKSPVLFAGLDRYHEKLFREGNVQHVVNCLWACATLGIQCPKLFARLDRYSEKIWREGSDQAIANSLWACAKLGIQSPQLFAGLDRHSERILQGETQSISNSLWACATLEILPPMLFASLDRFADKLLEEGTTQAIANSVWACATLGIQSPKLFAELDKYSEKILQEGSSQTIINTVWACVLLGEQCPKLFSRLDRYRDKIVADGNSRLSLLCWSIFLSETDSLLKRESASEFFKFLWDRVVYEASDTFHEGSLEPEIISLLCAIDTVGNRLGLDISPRLPNLFYHRFQETEVAPSKSHVRLSRSLAEMKYDHVCEFSPFEELPGYMAIDIALLKSKVAIEFDGPSHFYRYSNSTLSDNRTITTRFKRRILEAAGWSVVSIDFRVADANNYSRAWLTNLLEPVLGRT